MDATTGWPGLIETDGGQCKYRPTLARWQTTRHDKSARDTSCCPILNRSTTDM